MAKIKLSPPWSIFYDEVSAMFRPDPEVRVVMDENNMVMHVLVNNPIKSAAIAAVLPTERIYGNVTLKVDVPPPDGVTEVPEFKDGVELYQAIFDGNPRLSYIQPKTSIFDTSFYVVFKNEVVQYFNDNISDINSMCSTLSEDIARDIFGGDVLPNFCTDLPK